MEKIQTLTALATLATLEIPAVLLRPTGISSLTLEGCYVDSILAGRTAHKSYLKFINTKDGFVYFEKHDQYGKLLSISYHIVSEYSLTRGAIALISDVSLAPTVEGLYKSDEPLRYSEDLVYLVDINVSPRDERITSGGLMFISNMEGGVLFGAYTEMGNLSERVFFSNDELESGILQSWNPETFDFAHHLTGEILTDV